MARKTEDNTPHVVVVGMEEIIKKDLENHKQLLERTIQERLAFRQGVSNQVKRKKHYKSLIGGGKYNDKALRREIDEMNINIRHLSDKAKLASEKIDHHQLIVDTLTQQLEDQMEGLRILAEDRKREKNAS